MKGLDHAIHLKSLAQELITLAEKRAALKAELAAAKKSRKTAAGASRQKALAKQIKELSSAIDASVNEIGQPPPRRMERLSGVLPVTLHFEARGRKFEHPASTLDMSDHGLRVVTATSLIPGQTLDVFSSRALLGRCRVVWVTGGGTDRPSEVGLEILH
jgi:hypothetical protein